MIRWNKFINVMVKWFRIQQKHPPKRKRKPMERPTFSNTWKTATSCLEKKVHYVFQLGSNVWYTSTNGGCSADFPIAMWDCRTIPSVELSGFFPTTCMIMMMIPLIVPWSKDVTGLGESSFHPIYTRWMQYTSLITIIQCNTYIDVHMYMGYLEETTGVLNKKHETDNSNRYLEGTHHSPCFPCSFFTFCLEG